jgi:hypothetical protein
MMKAIHSPEKLVTTARFYGYYHPQNNTLNVHDSNNLKSLPIQYVHKVYVPCHHTPAATAETAVATVATAANVAAELQSTAAECNQSYPGKRQHSFLYLLK